MGSQALYYQPKAGEKFRIARVTEVTELVGKSIPLGSWELSRSSEQIVVSSVRMVMLPVPHQLQASSLRQRDELRRGGIEGHGSAALNDGRFPRELPVGHSSQHSEPCSEAVIAIQVRESFAPGRELRIRIGRLDKRNFSHKYPGARFGDAMDLAQAVGNLLPRNH